jgi:hypothetical protein
MSVVDFGTIKANATLKEVIDEVANDKDLLNFLLGGNIDFKNVRANSITADRIKANTITALQIMAGTITADKMDVAELSAISANLGTIIAGIIYGAYIATANGTFPRIELSSVGNLLTAYYDATHSLSIKPNIGGEPGIDFTDPSGITGRIYGNSGMGVLALINNVELTSLAGLIDLSAPLGIRINGVSGLLGTKVYYVSDSVGGAVNRKLTFTDGLLTSET